MKTTILLFTIITSILNCTPSASNNSKSDKLVVNDSISKPTEKIDFLAIYQKMITAIKTKDTLAFNQLIYANYGLYIIENTGAMPEITKIYKINKYKSKITQQGFFNLPFNAINLLPTEEILPKVICEAEVYNKQGCFYAQINPLKESELFNYAQLNEKEAQALQYVANTVQITVINTSNHTFYFSFIDNAWWLSFIDLRTPCEA